MRDILVYCVFLSVFLHVWNSAMNFLMNISLFDLSCSSVGVVCTFFVIVSGVVSRVGSVALVFGFISTLISDA